MKNRFGWIHSEWIEGTLCAICLVASLLFAGYVGYWRGSNAQEKSSSQQCEQTGVVILDGVLYDCSRLMALRKKAYWPGIQGTPIPNAEALSTNTNTDSIRF